jgi:chitinase
MTGEDPMTNTLRSVLVLVAAALLPACGSSGSTSDVGNSVTSAGGGGGSSGGGGTGGGAGGGGGISAPKRVVGYFAQWGIYSRSYFVKNVVTSGSAAKMTHLNYAFANVTSGYQTASYDAYADYQKTFSATESVDGQADAWNQPLAGNFNQLRKLKLLYPSLKILISLGGWTLSTNFSGDAMTDQSRKTLVASAIDMFIRGNFAPGLHSPGIFDGIDIDWEYPGANGNNQPYSPQDTQNFTLLLAEFRSELDAQGAADGRPYLLTIAAPAGADKFAKIQLADIHPYLDFINLMTYDFHGAWETTTNFSSPLFSNSADPALASNYWADYAVGAYLAAGTPPGKLTLGIPFYGRGWTGVPPGPGGNGLFQVATGGGAPGVWEVGINDYKALAPLVASSSSFRDPQSGSFWIYDGSIFWTFDDEMTVLTKMSYVKNKGLGGAMVWELDGDDARGTLISSIAAGLQ